MFITESQVLTPLKHKTEPFLLRSTEPFFPILFKYLGGEKDSKLDLAHKQQSCSAVAISAYKNNNPEVCLFSRDNRVLRLQI